MDRVDQLPLPSLQWYAAFSGLSLLYVFIYGVTSPTGLIHSLQNDLWCSAVSMVHIMKAVCILNMHYAGYVKHGLLLPVSSGKLRPYSRVWQTTIS